MFVWRDFIQHGGDLRVDACRTRSSGGGLRVNGSFYQTVSSSAEFNTCAASRGGGVSIGHSIHVAGHLRFNFCKAFGSHDFQSGRVMLLD